MLGTRAVARHAGCCYFKTLKRDGTYEIIVEQAAAMIEAMDHRGLVLYCEAMLNVIDKGGLGLVREDRRHWHEITRGAAIAKSGPTLLQLLIDVIDAAPATLTLLEQGAPAISRNEIY